MLVLRGGGWLAAAGGRGTERRRKVVAAASEKPRQPGARSNRGWRGDPPSTQVECGEESKSSTDISSRINKTPKLPPIARTTSLRIPSLSINLVSSMADPGSTPNSSYPTVLVVFSIPRIGRKGYGLQETCNA